MLHFRSVNISAVWISHKLVVADKRTLIGCIRQESADQIWAVVYNIGKKLFHFVSASQMWVMDKVVFALFKQWIA